MDNSGAEETHFAAPFQCALLPDILYAGNVSEALQKAAGTFRMYLEPQAALIPQQTLLMSDTHSEWAHQNTHLMVCVD